MFESVEEAFDAVAFGIHGEVSVAWIFDAGACGDDGFRAGDFDGFDNFLAVIAFVGDDILCRKTLQQWLCLRIVRRLSWRQDEAQRVAQTVDSGVDFCGQPAF